MSGILPDASIKEGATTNKIMAKKATFITCFAMSTDGVLYSFYKCQGHITYLYVKHGCEIGRGWRFCYN